MTTDDRPGDPRALNAWLGQLHWDARFCRALHGSVDVECQAPLGHATLGETDRLRHHTGFELDPATQRATRVTWTAAQARPLPVSTARLRHLLDDHPASGERTNDDDRDD